MTKQEVNRFKQLKQYLGPVVVCDVERIPHHLRDSSWAKPCTNPKRYG